MNLFVQSLLVRHCDGCNVILRGNSDPKSSTQFVWDSLRIIYSSKYINFKFRFKMLEYPLTSKMKVGTPYSGVSEPFEWRYSYFAWCGKDCTWEHGVIKHTNKDLCISTTVSRTFTWHVMEKVWLYCFAVRHPCATVQAASSFTFIVNAAICIFMSC